MMNRQNQTAEGMVDGRYELMTTIGSGGMGTVWRAHDRRLGRTVALKRPHPDSDADQRLAREAAVAASINHPHLVTVHDTGTDETGPYLVMEFIDAPACTRAELDLKEVLTLGSQVAGALAAAHAAGITHRDVKPDNILLADRGAVLVDFGLASSIVLDQHPVTQPGMVAATPSFAAPEVLAGQPPTPAADVYSLGATLNYLLRAHRLEPAAAELVARSMSGHPTERPSAATLSAELARPSLTAPTPRPATSSTTVTEPAAPTTPSNHTQILGPAANPATGAPAAGRSEHTAVLQRGDQQGGPATSVMATPERAATEVDAAPLTSRPSLTPYVAIALCAVAVMVTVLLFRNLAALPDDVDASGELDPSVAGAQAESGVNAADDAGSTGDGVGSDEEMTANTLPGDDRSSTTTTDPDGADGDDADAVAGSGDLGDRLRQLVDDDQLRSDRSKDQVEKMAGKLDKLGEKLRDGETNDAWEILDETIEDADDDLRGRDRRAVLAELRQLEQDMLIALEPADSNQDDLDDDDDND